MKPRTKFQQNVVAASKHLPPLTPAQNRMGVQELHRAYRTPHAERTYHLHRVRPHVAERKRRTHGQSVRVRVSALPHHAESGNHPAPQVQRLRVFVHRNPLQGFSSPGSNPEFWICRIISKILVYRTGYLKIRSMRFCRISRALCGSAQKMV